MFNAPLKSFILVEIGIECRIPVLIVPKVSRNFSLNKRVSFVLSELLKLRLYVMRNCSYHLVLAPAFFENGVKLETPILRLGKSRWKSRVWVFCEWRADTDRFTLLLKKVRPKLIPEINSFRDKLWMSRELRLLKLPVTIFIFPFNVIPGSNFWSRLNWDWTEKSLDFANSGLAGSRPLPNRLIFIAKEPWYW